MKEGGRASCLRRTDGETVQTHKTCIWKVLKNLWSIASREARAAEHTSPRKRVVRYSNWRMSVAKKVNYKSVIKSRLQNGAIQCPEHCVAVAV